MVLFLGKKVRKEWSPFHASLALSNNKIDASRPRQNSIPYVCDTTDLKFNQLTFLFLYIVQIQTQHFDDNAFHAETFFRQQQTKV